MENKSDGSLQKLSYRTVLKSLPVGALAGLVTVAFRVCVTQVFSFVQNWTHQAVSNVFLTVLWFAALIAATWAVGRLLKWDPMITGSGIPQLEGEIKGIFTQPPLKVLVGKFVGGILALGAGLSLGREGPCIQMGSVIGKQFSSSGKAEKDLLMASGGAAGLAAAFGAPAAGVIFALEEVNKRFSARLLLVSVLSCAVAGIVTRMLLGPGLIFDVGAVSPLPFSGYWLLIVLGAAAGGLGAFYNFFVQKMQAGYERLKKIPASYRVILSLIATGILAFLLPQILGGGDDLVARITDGSFTLAFLVLLLVTKLAFSVFSFSSGVPGGILMPMLVIGAMAGGVVGTLFSGSAESPELAKCVVLCAMAGLFGAIVRAPLTGAVLVCEMAGAYVLILPLVVTSFIAFFVARLLKARPIYDQLLEHDIAVFRKS